MNGLRRYCGFVYGKENKWVGRQQSRSTEWTIKDCQSKEASMQHAIVTPCGNKGVAGIIQGTTPGTRRQGRPRTDSMNIRRWTGLTMEESIRMAEDTDKRRKYVHGVADLRIEDGWRTEQNRYMNHLPASITQLFTCQMLFLMPNQQCQHIEDESIIECNSNQIIKKTRCWLISNFAATTI